MFTRYTLYASLGNDFVYEAEFKSLNQAVKFSFGFSEDCTVNIHDNLTDKCYPDSAVRVLVKEIFYA